MNAPTSDEEKPLCPLCNRTVGEQNGCLPSTCLSWSPSRKKPRFIIWDALEEASQSDWSVDVTTDVVIAALESAGWSIVATESAGKPTDEKASKQ